MKREYQKTTGQGKYALESLESRTHLAVNIQFDTSLDTSGLFKNPRYTEILQVAAEMLTQRLGDTLTAITPSGSNTWTARIFNPSTGALQNLQNLTVPANTVIIYVGARNLGTTELGEGGAAIATAQGTTTWINTANGRGQPGAISPTKTDFAPAVGSIAFDADTPYSLNGAGVTPLTANYDFLSLAEHEIGHVLGFGASDSWNRLVFNSRFNGPAVKAANAGTGAPLDPDLSHFKSGLTSGGKGVDMQPTLPGGVQRLFTPLDFAALDDIGWDLVPTPGTGAIIGMVYNDLNNNGRRGDGEAALGGFTVYLDQNNNSALDAGEKSVLTNANGQYLFRNLPAGNYTIRYFSRPGYRPSEDLVGRVAMASVTGGIVTLAKDFGVTTKVLIEGAVFRDFNADGLKNGDDYNLQQQKIFLDANNNGKEEDSETFTTTDSAGHYEFQAISPDLGVVRVRTIGDGHALPNNGTYETRISSGQTFSNFDFALAPAATFATTIYALPQAPRDAAVGDFNNDGFQDIALIGSAKQFEILLGNGSGGFASPITIALPSNATPAVIQGGDFDGDGKRDDLIVVDSGADSIMMFRGNTNGHLTMTWRFLTNATPVANTHPYDFTSGDWNGDGITDFAVITNQTFVTTMLADINGVPHTRTRIIIPNFYSGMTVLATADLNGDGKQDILTENLKGMVVLAGDGAGNFTVNPYNLPAGQGVTDGLVGVGDLNRDGRVDAISLYGGSRIDMLQNNGGGQALTGPLHAQYFVSGESFVVADFNGDRTNDLIATSSEGVDLLTGNGDFTFDPKISYPTGGSQSGARLAVGDFNGDGKPDLVVPHTGSSNVAVMLNTTPRPRTSNVGTFKDGVFSLDVTGRYGNGAGNISFAFGLPGDTPLWGDWNGDGVTDVGVRRGNTFYLDFNGSHNWNTGDVAFAFGFATDKPIVGDWDGDGRDEIGIYRTGLFWLDKNNDHMAGANDIAFNFGKAGDVPVMGDWNGDGITDAGIRRGNTFWIDGNANHALDPNEFSFVYGQATDAFVVGDWNGDRKDEIGIRRANSFWIDGNANYILDPDEFSFTFGQSGESPIAGIWI